MDRIRESKYYSGGAEQVDGLRDPSTAGMAEDAIVLLDYIGWTEKRGVHIVGISLGGMIAQGESNE